jgi:hypothetical protein
MEFVFRHSEYPENGELLALANDAAMRLRGKLSNLDANSLNLSTYMLNYFKEILRLLPYRLSLDVYILTWVLSKNNKNLGNVCLLEYGGGAGTMSLLAKEMGIGTVIYNDIYDVSCKDATELGRTLGIPASHYVQGDLEQVIEFVHTELIGCEHVVSYDVIEHIYDIEAFFSRLPNITEGKLSLMMSSGANNSNLRIRRNLMRHHRKVESCERDAGLEKGRDCEKPYLAARREIIMEYLNKQGVFLDPEDVDELSARTRGHMKGDIENIVSKFAASREHPSPPMHPTNTCDPYTGNWAEHLFDPFILVPVLERQQMNVRILPGYEYAISGTGIKGVLKTTANIAINHGGNFGMRLAPFYSIYAHRE